MSKIPYTFDTPIPSFFKKQGVLKNHKMLAFLTWAFSRCSTQKRSVYYIHKFIELDPFEFIFGWKICSEETGLSRQEIRTCINQQKTTHFGEILKKSTSKTTNKFTVYKWSIEVFSKNENHIINQQPTSNQPATNHNLDIRSKEEEKKEEIEKESEKEKEKEKSLAEEDSLFFFKKKEGEKAVSFKIQEEIIIANEFSKQKNILFSCVDLEKWIKNYDSARVLATIEILAKRKNIKNPAGWMEKALEKDYANCSSNFKQNKAFACEFKEKNLWNELKIKENYCIIERTGLDISFSLPIEVFKKILCEKFDNLHRSHNYQINY